MKKVTKENKMKKNKEIMNTNSTFMSPDELCSFLNIKKSRMRSLVFKKEIPIIKIGRIIRFDKQDIVRWLETKKCEPVN